MQEAVEGWRATHARAVAVLCKSFLVFLPSLVAAAHGTGAGCHARLRFTFVLNARFLLRLWRALCGTDGAGGGGALAGDSEFAILWLQVTTRRPVDQPMHD